MEDILARLLVADNNVIQNATQDLKNSFKKEETIPQLCQIMVQSRNPQIRQYAAVILKQRFAKVKYWEKLNVQARNSIKQGVLQALLNEPEKFVKKSIAQVIGMLIRHEIPKNSWPEVIEFVFNMCHSADEAQKMLGVFTLSILTEMSPTQFRSHSQAVSEMMTNVFQNIKDDSNPSIPYCVDVMKNLVVVAEDNHDMHHMFQVLLPRLSQILKQFIQNEVKACQILDMFEDLIDYGIITKIADIKHLLELCLQLCTDKLIEEPAKMKALGIIESCVRTKKKAIIKHNLLEPILNVVFEVMTNPNQENAAILGFDPDENDTSASVAVQVVDTMALNLPPDKLMPLLLSHIEKCLQGELYDKKAAYLTMAVISEGCADYIRGKYLDIFMEQVCQGLTNSLPLVKNSALYALGQFSEFLQPDVCRHSDRVFPVLFSFLDQIAFILEEGETEPENADRIFDTLESFTEYSEKDTFLPYLYGLMDKLFTLSRLKSSVHFKELIFSLFAASANAAEDNMHPYFPQIVDCMSPYLKESVEDVNLSLQTQAIDTLAALAHAVKPERFYPLSEDTVRLGLKLLKEQNDPELQSSAYRLFGAISRVMKEEMHVIMSPVIESMLNTLETPHGVIFHSRDKDGSPTGCDDLSDTPDEEDIEISDEEEDDDDFAGFAVENAYLDAKNAACGALKEIAANTGSALNPYLEHCFDTVCKLLRFPQDDIRKVAIETLCQLCINFAAPKTEAAQPALQKALAVFIPKCAEVIVADSERNVVVEALDAYATLLKSVKEQVVHQEGHKEAIMNCIQDVFKKRVRCQETDEESLQVDDEDSAEQEEMLLQSAGDVIPHLGRAIPPDEFHRFFVQLYPFLAARFKRKSSIAQRSYSIGILAECMEPLAPGLHRFVQDILPTFMTLAKDPHYDVRNNAIFGLGELVYHGKDHLYPHYGNILHLLSECIMKEEENPGVIDNICGALARMLLTNVSLVPLTNVFPCFVRFLPLRKDFKENSMIFKSLVHLYEGGHEIVLEHLEHVLSVTVQVVHNKQGEEDALLMAAYLFLCAHRDFPDRINNLHSSLPVESIPTFEELMRK